MKELKFLIIALGLMVAPAVFAVTLPTTSYQPYAASDGVSTGDYGAGSMLTGMRFSMLGESDWGAACVAETGGSQDILACQNCCSNKFEECCPGGDCDEEEYDECKELSHGCMNECGRSLPLDGGEWVLMLMIALAVVVGKRNIASKDSITE